AFESTQPKTLDPKSPTLQKSEAATHSEDHRDPSLEEAMMLYYGKVSVLKKSVKRGLFMDIITLYKPLKSCCVKAHHFIFFPFTLRSASCGEFCSPQPPPFYS